MKVTYKTGKFTVEAEGSSTEVFEQLASFDSVFGNCVNKLMVARILALGIERLMGIIIMRCMIKILSTLLNLAKPKKMEVYFQEEKIQMEIISQMVVGLNMTLMLQKLNLLQKKKQQMETFHSNENKSSHRERRKAVLC